jgi:hypothetical protein
MKLNIRSRLSGWVFWLQPVRGGRGKTVGEAAGKPDANSFQREDARVQMSGIGIDVLFFAWWPPALADLR